MRHFLNIPACQSKWFYCIKFESIYIAEYTNLDNLRGMGSRNSAKLEAEADTGTSISVFKGRQLADLSSMDWKNTKMHIIEYDCTLNTILGKEVPNLHFAKKNHEQQILFNNTAA